MVGENLGIYSSQLAKNTLKFSTMVGVNVGIYSSHHSAKNTLKLSNMFGENVGTDMRVAYRYFY